MGSGGVSAGGDEVNYSRHMMPTNADDGSPSGVDHVGVISHGKEKAAHTAPA